MRAHSALVLLNGVGRTKTVVDQTQRRIPTAIGVEDDEEKVAAVMRHLCDQASARFGREAGFDALHTGDATQ